MPHAAFDAPPARLPPRCLSRSVAAPKVLQPPPPSHTIIVEEVASMPAAPCCSAQGSWASSRASNDSSAARPTPRLMPHHTLARVTSMHAHTPYAAFDAPPHARPPPRCRVISKAAKRSSQMKIHAAFDASPHARPPPRCLPRCVAAPKVEPAATPQRIQAPHAPHAAIDAPPHARPPF